MNSTSSSRASLYQRIGQSRSASSSASPRTPNNNYDADVDEIKSPDGVVVSNSPQRGETRWYHSERNRSMYTTAVTVSGYVGATALIGTFFCAFSVMQGNKKALTPLCVCLGLLVASCAVSCAHLDTGPDSFVD